MIKLDKRIFLIDKIELIEEYKESKPSPNIHMDIQIKFPILIKENCLISQHFYHLFMQVMDYPQVIYMILLNTTIGQTIKIKELKKLLT